MYTYIIYIPIGVRSSDPSSVAICCCQLRHCYYYYIYLHPNTPFAGFYDQVSPHPPAVCSRPFAVPHVPLARSRSNKRTWRLIDRDIIYYIIIYIYTAAVTHIIYTQAARGSRDNPEFINSALCAPSRGGHTHNNNNIIIVLCTADLCSVWNCKGRG